MRMPRWASGLSMLSLTVTATGCSSKILVRDISGPPVAIGSVVEGVPIQFADRQLIRVYAKQPDGRYEEVHSVVYAVPDQARLFTVTVDSQWLANHTLTLALNDDGTPKTVGIVTASQAAAALTQFGTSAAAVATSLSTFEQQRQKAEAAALEQQAALQKDLAAGPADRATKVLAYRQALEAVIKQEAKLDNMPPDAKPLDITNVESDLRILKLQANQAARVLGARTPYPEADRFP